MSELGWQPKFIPIENISLEKIFLSILGTELQRFIIESEQYNIIDIYMTKMTLCFIIWLVQIVLK